MVVPLKPLEEQSKFCKKKKKRKFNGCSDMKATQGPETNVFLRLPQVCIF